MPGIDVLTMYVDATWRTDLFDPVADRPIRLGRLRELTAIDRSYLPTVRRPTLIRVGASHAVAGAFRIRSGARGFLELRVDGNGSPMIWIAGTVSQSCDWYFDMVVTSILRVSPFDPAELR